MTGHRAELDRASEWQGQLVVVERKLRLSLACGDAGKSLVAALPPCVVCHIPPAMTGATPLVGVIPTTALAVADSTPLGARSVPNTGSNLRTACPAGRLAALIDLLELRRRSPGGLLALLPMGIDCSDKGVIFLTNPGAPPPPPPRNARSQHIMRTVNLFISHSWAYSDAYDRLTDLLDSRGYFRYRNYSVPKDNPLAPGGSDAQLATAIRQQMQSCSIVIVVAGVYATYGRWIRAEVEIAKTGFKAPKPILAVRPRASKRISAFVREHADEIVGWNKDSIVDAIRKLRQS